MSLKSLIKKLKSPTVKEGIPKRINDLLKNQYNKTLPYKSEPSNSASTIGTPCHRKIYYNYFKIEKDILIDARGARIFETGKFLETMVISWLKGIGEHIPYRNKGNGEIPLDRDTGLPNPQFLISAPDWRIKRGYIDNVATIDGKLWLYEIKTSSSHKFRELEEPQADHKLQTAVYFKAFNDMLTKGEYSHIFELKGYKEAEGVKFLYLNKDTSELKVFSVKGESLQNNVIKLEEKIKKANNYADLKELPPKTPDFCNYCPYSKKCEKDWNNV